MEAVKTHLLNKELSDWCHSKGYMGTTTVVMDEDGSVDDSHLIPSSCAIAWLRTHNVYVYVEPFITNSGENYELRGYKAWIVSLKASLLIKISADVIYADTFEEATEKAIEYCLKNLI